jgi:hypothetical protein
MKRFLRTALIILAIFAVWVAISVAFYDDNMPVISTPRY